MEEKCGQRRTVVIAIDSSPNAKKAFQWYVDNLHRPGDHAVLVTVVHIRDAFTSAQWCSLIGFYDADVTARNIEKQRQELNRQLQELAVMMKDAKVHGTIKCVHAARASKGILAAAEDCNASCIIAGSRGLGIFQEASLGSTSEQLVHTSNITVVVCPD
ncbi:universal stress protein PHOS34-like [Mizuhopecten yessoensis]|uniref:UspA domain-containing protein n=1 Tax=Mizuhopecten yessoensis TaxID=6573 RepID=A0A210R2E8_MIZYE|nr:universal stress protein PHOS34-like [Mizuhopecten yessoensis]OWF55114.1 hypothetical protein KP79_PYT15742 [Mizuhopecten yessoensis]